MGTAILFLSHHDAWSVRRVFQDLRSAVKQPEDVYWLFDCTQVPVSSALSELNVWPFSLETLAGSLKYSIPHVVPGHGHAPVIAFALAHPQYDTFWVIEYDVRFSGHWGDLFRNTTREPADLLTTHLRRFVEDPEWHWWESLSHPTHWIPENQRVASFNPVYRVSRRALLHLLDAHRDGWTGHNEVLLPTLLIERGFRVADLSGTGSFGSEVNVAYYQPDTMRWRPPMWRGKSTPSTLSHPVKPLRWFVKHYRKEVSSFVGRARGRLRTALSWWGAKRSL
jgi:hypothetical protein